MAVPTLTAGVLRVRARFVNWYLVEEAGRVAAVDAGLPPSWKDLHEALARLGRRPQDLVAVVLTHEHVDHLGFAERARRELGATVYIHDLDAGLARHRFRAHPSERTPLPYLWRPATLRAVGAMLAAGAILAKPVHGLRTYRDGDVLDEVPGRPRVVFTPGHTRGHSSLHLPNRDVLITGDALVTEDPYTGRRGPRIVARAATWDSGLALRSLDRIAETGARTLLPGHGEPWTGDPAEAVGLAREAGVA